MEATVNRISIPIKQWQSRAAAHRGRVGAWADAFVARRSRGQKHPVDDFLFTYYNFSPAKLKNWLPSFSEVLEMDDSALDEHPWLRERHCLIEHGTLRLNTIMLDEQALRAARFIADLSAGILERPHRLRCFGLHEWAMVYQLSQEQIRHSGFTLRLTPDEISEFIESQALCCSHYDAFRFFTPAAKPLNAWQPTLDQRLIHEQGACLHANMDLYKWAYKLWPWGGSDLIADAFVLAREGRELDMRASPYDLSELGYKPVRIETEEGRKQYQERQQALAAKAEPLRCRLMHTAQALLAACDSIGP